jgi:hypothetical protein
LVLQPMTDQPKSSGPRSILALERRALEDPVFVRGKDLEGREPGGLLDPHDVRRSQGRPEVGASSSSRSRCANPVFETPIMTLTGLKKAQYTGLVQGKLWLNPRTGEIGDGPEMENHPEHGDGRQRRSRRC